MKGHIWQTLKYFAVTGMCDGILLGGYVGAACLPIMGVFPGGIVGLVIGLAMGLLCGCIAHAIHQRTFHEDIDLEEYSHHLSRIIGIVGGGSAAVMFGIVLAVVSQTIEFAAIWIIVALTSVSVVFLSALSAAYAASEFPAWSVRHFKRMAQSNLAEEVMLPMHDAIDSSFNTLIWHPASKWIAIVGGIGGWITLQWPITLAGLIAITLFVPFAVGVAAFVWAYFSFGNAMVLTFLKRVIYQKHLSHLSEHWYRISLTLISFVITWIMIWWTIIPGAIMAILMAYIVYHTLALPDEPIKKAKRKEKNALALQDDSDEDDEVLLVDEERLIEERERR